MINSIMGRSRRRRRQGGATRWWPWAAGAVALAVLVLLGRSLFFAPGPPQERAADVEAPDFALTMYQGEDVVGFQEGRFSELFGHGKPVVLNFWAGLCPPCRAEMPDFQQVYDARGEEFILLGLDVGPYTGLGSNEDGLALLRELGVTYPAGTTPDGAVVRQYEVRGMPTTVLLTSEGAVFRNHTGVLNAEALNDLLDRLIAASGS